MDAVVLQPVFAPNDLGRSHVSRMQELSHGILRRIGLTTQLYGQLTAAPPRGTASGAGVPGGNVHTGRVAPHPFVLRLTFDLKNMGRIL